MSINHATYGKLEATRERKGRMIVIRYGHHERRATASADDSVNEFVARDVLKQIVAEELKD
ncbi:hypothetical protein FHT78_002998 [Rhizobium sp. BK196]|jgi:hypothetical protein|uniref:hypothetical protein n=1 Tax=Rhizobium sp. BK196 TaxID=2587073 RepID=UPI00161B413B|nr:hypothetical protein [Rhizobium sp. BK196]MBB3311254.1 hypothetical protein [Rhizobium sp. BK196]